MRYVRLRQVHASTEDEHEHEHEHGVLTERGVRSAEDSGELGVWRYFV